MSDSLKNIFVEEVVTLLLQYPDYYSLLLRLTGTV